MGVVHFGMFVWYGGLSKTCPQISEHLVIWQHCLGRVREPLGAVALLKKNIPGGGH